MRLLEEEERLEVLLNFDDAKESALHQRELGFGGHQEEEERKKEREDGRMEERQAERRFGRTKGVEWKKGARVLTATRTHRTPAPPARSERAPPTPGL